MAKDIKNLPQWGNFAESCYTVNGSRPLGLRQRQVKHFNGSQRVIKIKRESERRR